MTDIQFRNNPDGSVEVLGSSPDLLRRLLADYRRILAEIGFPVRKIAPGQPGDVVRSRFRSATGLDVPEDVVVWFEEWDGPEDLLIECSTTLDNLDISLNLSADPEQVGLWDWPTEWILLCGQRPRVAVECPVGPNDPVRVTRLDSHSGMFLAPEPTGPVAVGLSTLVAVWIDAIHSGVAAWDHGQWRVVPEKLSTYPYREFV
jgi:hypothetical protein